MRTIIGNPLGKSNLSQLINSSKNTDMAVSETEIEQCIQVESLTNSNSIVKTNQFNTYAVTKFFCCALLYGQSYVIELTLMYVMESSCWNLSCVASLSLDD